MKRRIKPRTFAYLRVSSPSQDLDSQRLSVLQFARQNKLKIDEFVDVGSSSSRTWKERKLDYLFEKAKEGDLILVPELSRLARSISELLRMLDEHFIRQHINLITIKENLRIVDGRKPDMQTKVLITFISLFAEIEKDLISQRTLAGLEAARAQGRYGGRKKGTQLRLPLDERKAEIEHLISLGVPATRIARTLKVPVATLRYYISTRNLQAGT